MRLVIRAFNKDGYHKDIALMDERQVWMTDVRVDVNNLKSFKSGLVGIGVGIDPTALPEMVRFEVIIQEAGAR